MGTDLPSRFNHGGVSGTAGGKPDELPSGAPERMAGKQLEYQEYTAPSSNSEVRGQKWDCREEKVGKKEGILNMEELTSCLLAMEKLQLRTPPTDNNNSK